MLLSRQTLIGIKDGSITLAFRRWLRPTVKRGGTLVTVIGQLAIESVDKVALGAITKAEAEAAGFPSTASLKSEVQRRTGGDVYRVRLSVRGADPRIALRDEIPKGTELKSIVERLQRIDARSSTGPWTRQVLEIIAERPAVRAPELAADLDMEKVDFKTKVRTLKALGLTGSLKVGYRVSPRGRTVLKEL